MTPALSIVRPGLLTTIQDLGRIGHQSLGIAVCGALDPVALRAANALAGNPPEAGALEVLHLGPTMVVEADDVRMSFAGARATIEILPDLAAVRGRPVETMRSVRLRRGEVIRIGGSLLIVEAIRSGKTPQEACELAAKKVNSVAVRRGVHPARVAFLALDPKGRIGAACTLETGFQYAVGRPGSVELLKAKEIGPE